MSCPSAALLRHCVGAYITIAFLILALCFVGIGTAFGSPPHGGTQITATPTTRIVSLVPSLTELAFAIGAGDQVVGVSDFCQYPPAATQRPAVGGLVNPSLEGVLRLRPSIVLLYRSQTDFAARLKQLGVRSELFQVDTLADLYAAIGRLAIETGHTTTAAALSTRIRTTLAEIKTQSHAAGPPPVSGIVVVSRDPARLRQIFQAGPGNFLGELFQIAGGTLAITSGAAISMEDIIRANPHLIIDMSAADSAGPADTPNPGVSATNHSIQQRPGPWAALSTVPAVQLNQVYQWSDPHAKLLGPSVIETAWQMQQLVESASASGAALPASAPPLE